MNYEAYYDKFTLAGKYHDAFQGCIRIVPFITNASQSIYDKSCGVIGVTGEFFRLWQGGEDVVREVSQDVVDPVKTYLKDKMGEDAISRIEPIVSDIMSLDDSFNVIDTSFFKYVPVATSFEQGKRPNQRLQKGQRRVAEYIYSMVDAQKLPMERRESDNLFCQIIHEALENKAIPLSSAKDDDSIGYYILPKVRDQFNQDFKWLLGHRNNITVRYIPLLLHFYACFSLMQIIPRLDFKNKDLWDPDKPLVYYYMLASEHATAKSEAVLQGWSRFMKEDDLNLIFGRIQCLDILNLLLNGPVGLYPELLSRLQQQDDFEAEKAALEELLGHYQTQKREALESRQNAKNSLAKELVDPHVDSYEDFVQKLYDLCTNNHPAEYKTRFRRSLLDLMRVKLLENRRGYWVLTLDDEMLLFMIALVTKEQRTKIDEMYRLFTDYGICFNMATRNLIEKYLLKLNLLDRKSDSGEAQYVTVVL